MKIIPYHEAYESQVQSLYSIPVSGYIRLALERRPHSQIGAHVQCQTPEVYIVMIQQNDQVIGIFNIGRRPMVWQGQTVMLPYFCDLRIRPDYQNGSAFLRIIRFVNNLNLDLDRLPATTVVFTDNQRMIDMINKRAGQTKPSSIPLYQKVADIETFIVNKKIVSKSPYRIKKASAADTVAMNELAKKHAPELTIKYDYQLIGTHTFYHQLDLANFILVWDNEELIGMIHTWDTTSFKQTKVAGYHPLLSLFRPLYNILGAAILGYPSLPSSGQVFKTIGVNHIIIKDRSTHIFLCLMAAAQQMHNNPLMVTCDTRDPIYSNISSLKATIRKQGKYYLVTHSEKIMLDAPYINIDVSRI